MTSLLAAGYSVSIPWGDNQRYDVIIDDGESLFKVQTKTGRIRDGSILFDTKNGPNKIDYQGQIDYFGVYCPDNQKCYLVPIEDVLAGGKTYLRLLPNERLGYEPKWAINYEF